MKRFLASALMLLGPLLLAGPALAAGCELGKMAELAVTMTELRPMVPAKINGADARFIADSGAFYSVITPASAIQYGLRLGPAPFNLTMEGVGGDVAISLTTVKTFTLADAAIPNVQCLVGGGEPGAGAAGILGQNVLGLADVEYDLANGVIRLMSPRGCGGRILAYWAGAEPYSVIGLDNAGLASRPATGTILNGARPPTRGTMGTVLVNGARIHADFDTGASTSVLSLRAAARAGVKPGDPGVIAAGMTRGLGRRMIDTWIAPVTSFKIGDEEIRNTRLRIGDLGLRDDVEMLIGADFFLSHHIYVANSQRKLYFTYNGGPVFNLAATARVQEGPGQAPKASPPLDEGRGEPTDAEGFSRRGAAFAARRRFDQAIADFTRACELAPSEGRYFHQRAMARLASGRPALATADLDRALDLDAGDVASRVARAELRLAGGDKAQATADLDAAAGFAAKEADVRLNLAELYERAGRLAPAIVQYGLWIAAHPADSRMAQALNGRCWVRSLNGHDLDKALTDCNAALKLAPRTPQILDSRGLARLRLGDFDKAIADYDAALTLRPKTAWSLYGRGLAELRKGKKAQGDADMAAAIALQPRLADEAKQYGIGPLP
ncbi:MAG: aspartyl protease family protein [Pseudomonadota bacterium]|nr:aspartyl protease family protein [Pseudomonadota bacterium]